MIWDFQDTLSRRLLLWSALSVVAGAILLLTGGGFWRGFGVQALAWGAIDAAIALFGQRSAARRRARGLHSAEALAHEATNLRRLLWINTALDVLYVTGGLVLLYTWGAQNPFAAGNGWGIIAQGGFLFFFDLLHALATPRKEADLPALDVFAGPEHAPFRLSGSQSLNGGESHNPDGAAPAALLVHGFGGTPAEMRGLAEALHREGWTVEVLLLPGFGADIATLTGRRYQEWLDAVAVAAQRLQDAGQRPLLLVGYSMGATLALALAPAIRPEGVVVLAPFWWEEKPWTRVVEFFVRPFLPIGFRPLHKADFGDPKLRQGIVKFMPGLNLDDPATQATLRDFRVPLGLIDQVRALSRRMLAALPQVGAPMLVVQGTRDSVVRTGQTQKLLRRLKSDVRYVEVEAEHDLTLPENPAWPQVAAAVVSFAQEMTHTMLSASQYQP
ncbi:MAG: alpha/beta hydrolase [Anaerolineae bacterium]